MSKRRTFITPRVDSTIVELASGDGLTFRKKILPLTTINYPMEDGTTRKVTFDRQYHQEVIDSFRKGAYDNPTLQLATESNAHNMLPERTAGTIIDVGPELPTDTDGPGLYATIRALTPEHADLLRKNVALGASAQIKERHERVDGRRFRNALRHVLATIDPRVTGMGSFRAVSLSNDEGTVIDLSDANYEETEMGAGQNNQGGLLSLSDEEIEDALAQAAEELGDVDPDAEDGADGEDDAEGSAGAEGGDGGSDGDAGDGGTRTEGTDLSNTNDTGLVSLAARVDDYGTQTRVLTAKLAEADWQNERRKYSQAGVPKTFLDLAETVLSKPDEAVIELSNTDGGTDQVDAKGVIRKMLDAARGTIDLSSPDGLGLDPSDTAEAGQNEIQGALDAWTKRSGG